jgi:hypothetical protein
MTERPKPDYRRHAEQIIATWATSGGATPQPVRYDVEGWDLLIRIHPPTSTQAALDMREGDISVLVQVKSTVADAARSDVTLSNWERLAKHPLPSFYAIVVYDPAQYGNDILQINDVFLVHVDGTWISKTLARLRTPNELPPHKQTMALVWTEANKLSPPYDTSLVRQLATDVGGGLEYIATKIRWLQQTGFEDRPMKIYIETAKMPGYDSVDRQMAEFAVGLLNHLPSKLVKAELTRFGLVTAHAELQPLEGREVSLEIPDLPCLSGSILTATSHDGTATASISGDLYHSHAIFPFLNNDSVLIRLKGAFWDILFHDGTKASLGIDISRGDPCSIEEMSSFHRMMTILQGRARILLSSSGIPPYEMECPEPDPSQIRNSLYLLILADAAWSLLQYVGGPKHARIVPSHLEDQKTSILECFACLSGAPISFGGLPPGSAANGLIVIYNLEFIDLSVVFMFLLHGDAVDEGSVLTIAQAPARLLHYWIVPGPATDKSAIRDFVDEYVRQQEDGVVAVWRREPGAAGTVPSAMS